MFFVLTKGMSTVGPRPALPAEVATDNDYQRQRLLVKPGLTCYWQTRRNRDSITFDEWVDLDLWKHIDFKPNPGELALNLYDDIDNVIAGEKVYNLISKAAIATQCRNARSIMKAKPLVEILSASSVLADSKRAASGRKDAFVEAVGYAFMKAMGNAPEPPQKTTDVQLTDEKWLEHANKEKEYEHYRDVGIIERYFDAGEFVSQEEVDASLAKFMDSRFADSEGAARMIASMNRLNHITDYDEEEAERCVKEFSDAAEAADYNPCDIKRVVSRAADVRAIGIAGAPSAEAMFESGKRLIDCDVSRAYKDFHADYANGAPISLTKISILLSDLITIVSKNIGRHALNWQNRLLTQALKSSLTG